MKAWSRVSEPGFHLQRLSLAAGCRVGVRAQGGKQGLVGRYCEMGQEEVGALT